MHSLDRDELLRQLESASVVDLYRRTLEYQAAFCSDAVRAALARMDLWRRSKSMLDAGCGPASFAKEYEDLLTDKAYLGIDLDPEFVEAARGKFPSSSHMKFQVGDLYQFNDGSYDLILLWAVLQHTPDTKRALTQLARLARQGILILDSRPGKYEFESSPELPALQEAYAIFGKGTQNRNADSLNESEAWARENGWKITNNDVLEVKATSGKARDAYFPYACCLGELFARKFGMNLDRKQLVAELQHWRAQEDAWVINRGGQWLCLERP